MRLIDADALIEQTETLCSRYEIKWTDNRVMTWIDNAPTIDAEPVKHGYDTGKCRIFHCSVCGYGFNDIFLDNERDYPIDPNYCPNCGAKMDKEE